MALCRYACCAQAALELVAPTGGAPASWSEPLPGERPRVDGDEQPLLPEPGDRRGELRVPEALVAAAGVDLLHMALRGFAALETAQLEREDLFGCNDHCAELEEGCSSGPHIPEHMIDEALRFHRPFPRLCLGCCYERRDGGSVQAELLRTAKSDG